MTVTYIQFTNVIFIPPFFYLKGLEFLKMPPPQENHFQEHVNGTSHALATEINASGFPCLRLRKTSSLDVHPRYRCDWLPITDDFPAGEPWVLTNQGWIVSSCCPEQLICTHITLVPPRGEVPVGQSKGRIADESLEAEGMPSHLIHAIRYDTKVYKANTDRGSHQMYSKI